MPGMDFHDTFTPVTKLTSNCIILALAARNDWEVTQMDIKGAYLNANLDEEIFMAQLPGFSVPGKENHACQIFKAIFRLKQVG